MSPVPALPLVLTHKLFVGSSSIPRWCSTHSSRALTEGDTPSVSPLPVLPKEPVSLHSNTPLIGAITLCLCDASKVIGLQVRAHLYPLLYSPCCVRLHRHLSWAPDGTDLLAGVREVRLCCPSCALMLTCDPPPGSGHLLLARTSDW